MKVKLSNVVVAVLLLPPLFWPRYISANTYEYKENSQIDFLNHESSPSDPSKSYFTLPLDPGSYYAQINRKRFSRRRNKKPRQKSGGLLGSFKSNKKKKKK